MRGPGYYEKGREPAKRRGGQCAAGHELQATVKLGLPSPIDGQRKGNRERGYVKEGNQQVGLRIPCVQNGFVESHHGDRRGEANHSHCAAERRTEPADSLVPSHLTRSHERRLKDKEEYPPEEHCSVNVEQKRARRRGVDELLLYRVAESIDHYGRDDQRHGEVEIVFEQARRIRRSFATRERLRRGSLFDV